nr:PREDICTED: polypeptide N-acetylgalactosaminyltransferase 18-like isoform X3 [Paralichthys olivaceus]
MLCSRRTKTLVSTCVILSGMTNIVCLLYVGWITNYVANGGHKVAESGGGDEAQRKLEEDGKGETLRIMERLDRLESVVNEHIKGLRTEKTLSVFGRLTWKQPELCSDISSYRGGQTFVD